MIGRVKKYKFLILIILLGSILRLADLGSFPVGVTGDEIQQGYSGYSILHTGKDEWGDFLPVNPRGFGDYKPPLYSYLTIPTEAVFGLNIFAVRLPAALAGIATIAVVFFLAFELFGSKLVSNLSSLLLAVSPWHIEYSRMAHESNIGIFLFILALLLFLKSFKRRRLLTLSAIAAGLSLFTYHSFKVFTVILFGVLFLTYRKSVPKIGRRTLILGSGIFILFLLVALSGVIFSGAGRRATDAALYNPENITQLRDIQTSDPLPQPWGRVINNKPLYLVSEFVQNYLGYFSADFWFSPFRSDFSVYNFPGQGLLYVWEGVLILIGIYYLLVKRPTWWKLLIAWLLLASVPAALTRDYMLAQRVDTFIPLFSILSGLGLSLLYNRTTQLKVGSSFKVAVVAVIITLSLVSWLDFYLFHTFNRNLGGIKYGYSAIVSYTESMKNNYSRIIFTKANSEPQAFVAFYSRMDPATYQSYSKNWKYFETNGFKFLDMTDYSLGKYQFRGIDWGKDSKLRDVLIIAAPSEVPPEVKAKFKTYDLTGKVTFEAIDPSDN